MTLHGERILLRPIVMADAKRFARWFSDPAVHKFTLRRRVTLKEERQWIRGLKRKEKHFFAIDTRDGAHIGSVGLHVLYKNRGFGTDAMKTILRYGFQKLKFHRIELGVYAYNPRAIHVYKRLGFKYEGRQRRAIRWRNAYYDRLIMGMLREEWARFNTSKK